MTTKKIKLEDLGEADLEAARNIVHWVCRMQTIRPSRQFILPTLGAIKALGGHAGLYDGLDAGLHAGLHDGLRDGLDDDLRDGLHDGLYAGLDAGLDAGLRDGLRDGFRDGLHDGLYAGLDAGLYDGLYAGLDAGLYDGLRDGLDAGLHAGLHDGLRDGLDDDLRDGLHAGLDAGLRDGLRDGFRDGLRDGLHDGLYAGLHDGKLRLIYCGVFWSWWLCRYMIAAKWGCSLDMRQLQLLFGFCVHTPIVLEDEKKQTLIAKPTKIHWRVSGKTKAPFELPIYELHSDGESTVECAGLKLYYWHNIRMPEKYGSVRSSEWQPEWFIKEQNVELKRVLVQGIGYEKLFHALEAKKLDAWREYELFRIENVDVEPVHILTMVCPSTGKKHFGRVPPDCVFARDAAKARNCGIDPEEFWIER